MFKFFRDPKWFLWAYIGSAIILSSLWVQVQIDVKINEWFGEFYDMIQEALSAPNAITIEEYWASLLSFITLAGMYVAVAVLVSYLLITFYLDGELPWLSGITLSMIRRVRLRVRHKEFKRIP